MVDDATEILKVLREINQNVQDLQVIILSIANAEQVGSLAYTLKEALKGIEQCLSQLGAGRR